MTVVGIGVFDIETAWITAARRDDPLNLTNAIGRRLSPVITGLVGVRIGHRSDIPVGGVITDLRRPPVKIRITKKQSSFRFTFPEHESAEIVAVIAYAMRYVIIGEGARRPLSVWAIAARLSKRVWASSTDCRNRADTGVSLPPNEAMGISVLILVSDCSHRTVVPYVIAPLQERVSFLRRQVFMDVVSSIVVMRVRGVREIRRAVRVIDSDQHLLLTVGSRWRDRILNLIRVVNPIYQISCGRVGGAWRPIYIIRLHSG